MLKKLGIALVVAVAVGSLLGGASRALMRLATVVVGGQPGFSWQGTFFILLIYTVAAIPVAVFAAFTRRWWRWIAGAAGTALLAVPAASITAAELGSTSSWTTAQWAGAVAVTVAIFATTVGLPVLTVRIVDRTVVRGMRRQAIPSLAV